MPEFDFHEAADRLGVSWHTVRRRAKEGRLPARFDEALRKWIVTIDEPGPVSSTDSRGAQEGEMAEAAERQWWRDRLARVEASLEAAQEDRDRMRDDLERIYREITDERRRLLDLLEFASRANATSLTQIAEQLVEQRAFRSEVARWMAETAGRPFAAGGEAITGPSEP